MKLYELSKKTIFRITKMVYDEFGTNNFDVEDLNDTIKILGITVNTVLDVNFIWTTIKENSSSLLDGTLSSDNIIIPTLKSYNFVFVEHAVQSIDYYYNYNNVELFSSNHRHFKLITQTEDYDDCDPYWNSSADDTNYGDSDITDTTITNIKEN